MSDPITPTDLYGPSNPPQPEGQPEPENGPMTQEVDQPIAGPPVSSPIPVEETPEITVETPASSPVSTPPPYVQPAPPKPKGSFWKTVGVLLLFIGLFGVGIWLSSYIRKYFPNGLAGMTPQQQAVVNVPTPTPPPADPFASWKTYQVISGVTKLPIEGVSYKLPADILAPTCDTTTCMSQGTYLPGGTRFTIAPRGQGQLLSDYRGSAISDVGGITFTSTSTTVGGQAAMLFSGSFAGKTVGGYGFSQMKGYMIALTPTTSLEINHFTPTGVTADFATDDTLFDQIVGELALPATGSALPAITPYVAPVSATASGS